MHLAVELMHFQAFLDDDASVMREVAFALAALEACLMDDALLAKLESLRKKPVEGKRSVDSSLAV